MEVLLAEVVGGGLVRLFIDHPQGVSLELCERVTNHLAAIRERLRAGGLLAGDRAAALQARALPPLRRPPRPRAHARPSRRAAHVHRRAAGRDGRRGHRRRGHRRRVDPLRGHHPFQSGGRLRAHVGRDRRGSQGARAREGHLGGEADGRAGGRAPVRLQEAAGRRPVRPRAHGPRLRRLHRGGVPAAARPRGPAPGRGGGAGHRRAGAPRGPGDRRGHHPRGAGHRSRRA